MKRLFSAICGIIFVLCISLNTTKIIYASDIPNIYKVDSQNPRMYEGNTENIKIYTKANSKIQYKFWLYSKQEHFWKELTSTYTDALSPEKTYTFTIPELKVGEYTLSIWVKREGEEPLNNKGYDNYYAYNFFCSHYDGQVYDRTLDKTKTEKPSIPSIEKVVGEVPYLQEGTTQTYDILSKGFEDVQYRVWLNNKSEKKWTELTKGYSDPIYAQKVYKIKSTSLSLGEYAISVWIKRANKIPLNVKGYDDYATFNFIISDDKNENNLSEFDKLKNNYELNEKIEINSNNDINTQYRYNIYDILDNKFLISDQNYKNQLQLEPLKEGAYIFQLDIKTLTEIKVDKDIDIPSSVNPILDENEPTNDEKNYEAKIVENVTTINKLIVVGKPYKKTTGKVVFLTFDDGPSTSVTPKILDILDEYNVKATFFVTGINANAHNDLIKEIYDNGHVIANHSYSHNYSKIYSSTTALINEIEETYNTIKKVIPDYDTKIFRFPGGSYGKDDSFKLAVKEDKYVYYDWNALNGDAEGYLISKDKLIARAKETIKNQASVIILMHDANVKTTTVDALPDIIEYLINSGYEFKTLDEFNN